MKQPGKVSSRVDALSRGLRSRRDAAKERGSQALTTAREKGSQAASATKQEVSAGARATGRGLRAAGEAVEPAGLQRRRGGGPEARAQRNRAGGAGGIANQMGRGTQGGSGSKSRLASVARRAGGAIAGEAKAEWGRMKDTAARGGVRGFVKPKTEAPKAKASTDTGSKPKWGQPGFATARGDWKAMEKAEMQKAVVSLQKFLDDCGCDD